MTMEMGLYGYISAEMAMEHVEILQNAKVGDKSLVDVYAAQRDAWITHDETDSVSFMGLSGAGKTALAMGFYELARKDETLKAAFKGRKEVEVVPVPFTLYPELCKLLGLIPRNVPHGQYSTEQYKLATQMMHEGMVAYDMQHPDKKHIYIIEGSAPTVRPDLQDFSQDMPWDTNARGLIPIIASNSDGVIRDRGLSVIYSYGVDRQRGKHNHVFAVGRNGKVRRLGEAVRDTSKQDVISNLQQSGVNVVLEGKTGRSINIKRLTKVQLQELNAFIQKTFAPVSGMQTSNEEFDRLVRSIPHTDIKAPFDHGFYSWLKETHFVGRNLSTVTNDYLEKDEPKSYLVRYFLDALPCLMYPDLIPPSLRVFV